MTQNEMVMQYMREFGSISALEAFADLGIMRLASRISDLKTAGIRIKTETESKKNRFGKTVSYARYSLG